MLRTILALAVACAIASAAFAQSADVTGTVVDESNAAIPGATVTLSGAGPSMATQTGPRGEYTFHNVPAGAYRVTATLVGFAAAQTDVTVAAAGAQVAPITLKIANLTDTVVVTATRSDSARTTAT
jgi:hypothetical protein